MIKCYKFLLILCVFFFISTPLVFSQHIALSDNNLKDTLVIKTLNDGKNILIESLPFIIAIIGISSTLITVFVTNKNQRKIAQANIVAEYKRQWIKSILPIAEEVTINLHQLQEIALTPLSLSKAPNGKSTSGYFQEYYTKFYQSAVKLELYFSITNKKHREVIDLLREIQNNFKEFRILQKPDDNNTEELYTKYFEKIYNMGKLFQRLLSSINLIVDLERIFIEDILTRENTSLYSRLFNLNLNDE